MRLDTDWVNRRLSAADGLDGLIAKGKPLENLWKSRSRRLTARDFQTFVGNRDLLHPEQPSEAGANATAAPTST